MTKRYVGQEITVATVITDAGTVTDPTTVSFKYRIGRLGTDSTATVTNTAVGVYEATIIPTVPGTLYGSWTASGTHVDRRPVIIPIHDAQGFRM